MFNPEARNNSSSFTNRSVLANRKGFAASVMAILKLSCQYASAGFFNTTRVCSILENVNPGKTEQLDLLFQSLEAMVNTLSRMIQLHHVCDAQLCQHLPPTNSVHKIFKPLDSIFLLGILFD